MTSDERLALDALRAEFAALRSSVDKMTIVVQQTAKQTEDHEDRLRKVEAWRQALPVSTLIFLGTTAIALVGLFLRG